MKAKKALKRLTKAESLLANVLDQYPAARNGLRELLDSARTSLSEARAAMDQEVAPPMKKAPAKAKESGAGRLTEAGRKRISLAAKKRWAAARRKKTTAPAKPLSKTA
jgi:small-conductance mechanosensitive channel